MRLLVTGAQGQVGRELARLGTGHELLALGRKELDITDEEAVSAAIREFKPDAVINAAAYTAVDKAESDPETAYAVNRDGPSFLARACHENSAVLLHISTDYVFDGSGSRPYREDDPVSPLGVYGKSKAEGEDLVRRLCPSHVILRTSWVFSPHGANFVKTIIRLAQEHHELKVVADQNGCPTSAGEIAKTLLHIVGSFRPDRSGTYHFAQPEPTTWHAFSEAIVRAAKKEGLSVRVKRIRPIPTSQFPTPAKRPAWSVLDCTKISQAFGIAPVSWRVSLQEVVKKLVSSETKDSN